MSGNYFVWGFGCPKFSKVVGSTTITALFPNDRGYLLLSPIGREDTNDNKNIQNRLWGFRGKIITIHQNYNSTTVQQMKNLLQIINDTIQVAGNSANKTLQIIPQYAETSLIYGEATNQSYNCCMALDQDLKFDRLTEKQESIESCSFVWIIPNIINTLPMGLTYAGTIYLTGDDDALLTGDDDENLEQG